LDWRGPAGLGGGRAQGRRQPAGGRRRAAGHRGGIVLRPGGRVRRAVRRRGVRRAGRAARGGPPRSGPGHQGGHRHLVRDLRRDRAQAHPGVRDDRDLRPGLVHRLTRPCMRTARLPVPPSPHRSMRLSFLVSCVLHLLLAIALLWPPAPVAAAPDAGAATAPATPDVPAAGPAEPGTPPTVAPESWLPDGEQVRGRFDFTFDRVLARLAELVANLPLLLAAILIVALSAWVGGFASRRLHLLRLRTHNPYMNGLIRNVVRTVIVLCGVLVALDLLNATALVTAVLGSAGVIGLVLGFAFKDIAENYIAGILLSLRQPFSPGD